ncbi:MAG: hypothetical protein GWN55_17115 [Phycisphaerae bacterium]|nr:hypothetical protein [Phycisphaerae bacterium]NIP55941.1 hypothetical protein [Phycisphaerae bacterium]NIU12142.1 hypothetical protein [Phycisphaerae bacterium]NIV03010.1 hypothetical protein [Phycisphaerae bacterium]NIX00406.1 hypothetical protein [Phycisphaerae bacterium]
MGKTHSWIYPVVGWGLIGHFVFCLCRSLYVGEPENVLWISHMGTLIGGAGACLRNRRLISLALVICFWHHLFWIFDTLTWLITGEFAIGATSYLQNRSLGGWLQSANHFFTVPALLFLVLLQGSIEKHTWIWSGLLFLCLLAISLIFLPPESNVNCAHQPWPGLEQIISQFIPIDPFSLTGYLIFIITFTVFGNYLPTNLILGYVISRFVVSKKYTQNDTE